MDTSRPYHPVSASGGMLAIGKRHLYANQIGHHHDPRNSFVPRGPHRLGFDGEWMAYNFHHENHNTYYHTALPEKIYYGAGVYMRCM